MYKLIIDSKNTRKLEQKYFTEKVDALLHAVIEFLVQTVHLQLCRYKYVIRLVEEEHRHSGTNSVITLLNRR